MTMGAVYRLAKRKEDEGASLEELSMLVAIVEYMFDNTDRGIQLTGLSVAMDGRWPLAGKHYPRSTGEFQWPTHRAWTAPEQHAPGAPLT